MERKKVILVCLTVIVISFIVMTLSIYINDKELSCNNCEIKFTTRSPLGEIVKEFDINVNDLYVSLVERNKCEVKWSKSGGYYEN